MEKLQVFFAFGYSDLITTLTYIHSYGRLLPLFISRGSEIVCTLCDARMNSQDMVHAHLSGILICHNKYFHIKFGAVLMRKNILKV